MFTSIVAVHGLGGHREKSWTTPRGTNWLQSLLPRDIPNSRIMTWGYDASPSRSPDREPQSLQNVSKKLVLDLFKMRETTKVSKFRLKTFDNYSKGYLHLIQDTYN